MGGAKSMTADTNGRGDTVQDMARGGTDDRTPTRRQPVRSMIATELMVVDLPEAHAGWPQGQGLSVVPQPMLEECTELAGYDDLLEPGEGELLWQERALCAQTDPEAFFPEKGGSTREAKKVCLTCDVRAECLDYALANDERFGIWGGLSERERRKLKKRAI